MGHEWTQICELDGCDQPVEIARRPDGRYRVRHGHDPMEGDVRFYSFMELFATQGYRAFARERHAERANS